MGFIQKWIKQHSKVPNCESLTPVGRSQSVTIGDVSLVFEGVLGCGITLAVLALVVEIMLYTFKPQLEVVAEEVVTVHDISNLSLDSNWELYKIQIQLQRDQVSERDEENV